MKCQAILLTFSTLAALTIAGCGTGTGPASEPAGGPAPTASNCVNAACHGSAFDSASSPAAVFGSISSASSKSIAAMHIAQVNIGSNFTNPLFKTMTASTKRLPQYVFSGSRCSDCHSHQNADNRAIRLEWAESVHGEHTAVAWKNINGKLSGYVDGTSNYLSGLNSGGSGVGIVCVRCHTKTGFVNFATSDYLTLSRLTDGTDKTKEVLSCDGCHTDISTGTIRTIKPFRGFWGYSTVAANGRDWRLPRVTTQYTFTDLGASNVCVSCHVGRNIVNSSPYLIKALNVYDTYSTVRTKAGGDGTIIGTNGHGYKNYAGPDLGYEFSGANYTEKSYSHSKVGIANLAGTGTKGACVGCHMRLGKGHSYEATAAYTDYGTVCGSCHGVITDAVNKTSIDALLIQRTDAVKVVQALLSIKFNVPFVATGTYTQKLSYNFAKVIRWYTTPTEKTKRANYQGAHYNTTYVAATNMYHNPLYSRRLLFDSADFIVNFINNDGTLKGDTASIITAIGLIPDAKLPNLLADGTGRTAADQRNNAILFFSAGRP